MNYVIKTFAVLVMIFSTLFVPGLRTPLYSQPSISGEQNTRTLSPYFFVKSDDQSTDRLPLKTTSALVNISGVIADVTVTQVYKNEGKKAIEAIYIFPALNESCRARHEDDHRKNGSLRQDQEA
jgi:Ca-activated chloride channel family protein